MLTLVLQEQILLKVRFKYTMEQNLSFVRHQRIFENGFQKIAW